MLLLMLRVAFWAYMSGNTNDERIVGGANLKRKASSEDRCTIVLCPIYVAADHFNDS